ncbi:hypothetical protein ACXZ66_01095 [Corynebacterium sp. S7]
MSLRKVATATVLASALLLTSCASSPRTIDGFRAESLVSQESTTAFIDSINSSAFKEQITQIEEEFDSLVAISVYSPNGNVSLGSIATMPAWSTIKVPIALASLEQCSYDDELRDELIADSLEWSDNDSAYSLWTCLGTDDEAKDLVEDVVAESGTSINIAPAYGMTEWSVAAQARYGYSLTELDSDNPVIQGMSNVIDEQSFGIGEIDGAVFKGGWSDTEEGTFQTRQFGFIEVGGEQYGIAIAADSLSGSQEDTQSALTELIGLLDI